MYCYVVQCYFAIEMATKLRCYYIIWCTVYSTDFVRYTVLPLIRFGVVYCSLANALPHFRL